MHHIGWEVFLADRILRLLDYCCFVRNLVHSAISNLFVIFLHAGQNKRTKQMSPSCLSSVGIFDNKKIRSQTMRSHFAHLFTKISPHTTDMPPSLNLLESQTKAVFWDLLLRFFVRFSVQPSWNLVLLSVLSKEFRVETKDH